MSCVGYDLITYSTCAHEPSTLTDVILSPGNLTLLGFILTHLRKQLALGSSTERICLCHFSSYFILFWDKVCLHSSGMFNMETRLALNSQSSTCLSSLMLGLKACVITPGFSYSSMTMVRHRDPSNLQYVFNLSRSHVGLFPLQWRVQGIQWWCTYTLIYKKQTHLIKMKFYKYDLKNTPSLSYTTRVWVRELRTQGCVDKSVQPANEQSSGTGQEKMVETDFTEKSVCKKIIKLKIQKILHFMDLLCTVAHRLIPGRRHTVCAHLCTWANVSFWFPMNKINFTQMSEC